MKNLAFRVIPHADVCIVNNLDRRHCGFSFVKQNVLNQKRFMKMHERPKRHFITIGKICQWLRFRAKEKSGRQRSGICGFDSVAHFPDEDDQENSSNQNQGNSRIVGFENLGGFVAELGTEIAQERVTQQATGENAR